MAVKRSSIDIAWDVVACFVKAPRMQHELALLVGTHEDRIVKHLKAARGEGLVYIDHYTSHRGAVYAWQPSPFERPDAPLPPVRYPHRPSAHERLGETVIG